MKPKVNVLARQVDSAWESSKTYHKFTNLYTCDVITSYGTATKCLVAIATLTSDEDCWAITLTKVSNVHFFKSAHHRSEESYIRHDWLHIRNCTYNKYRKRKWACTLAKLEHMYRKLSNYTTILVVHGCSLVLRPLLPPTWPGNEASTIQRYVL